MTSFRSALYQCRITHQRSRPRRHHLGYSAFYMLLDLDELEVLHRKLRWFSLNRFNLLSFYDRDHGPGTDQPLKAWVEHHLTRAGVQLEDGRIEMLCLPRILGYAFNPLTVYYCYDRCDALRAVLYEVSNTFDERHTYLFELDADHSPDRQPLLRHDCMKQLYVSPFSEVAGRYHFRIKAPTEQLYLHIHQTDSGGPLLDAWVRGKRSSLSDQTLLCTLLRNPLLALKVIGGIHWEALRLWLKGLSIKDRPPPPDHPVTLIKKSTA